MSVYSPERREAARQRALAAYKRAPVDPSLEEIAERCEQIQSDWTRKERRLRYLMARTIESVREVSAPYWTPPELCCVDYCEG
jgi:hypothetical protein